ncbi:hypothetical protein B841_01140 [Corynebacterium maris DSM 45190]|uniref:Uncharacterized protein n=1 Tax=Corynebacterium maris DSM 45190 TaxID=1224163 RepID=S5TFK5_9CORY|nr:hypothetical protein [Corynebacterium maris]AGS33711.1 hypothetical protein B841_01140 [Corynebacterium maris DSM 45190]
MSRKPVRRDDPDDADAEVIPLTSRAQRRGRASAGYDSPRTLILQISHVRTDAEAHRHIGIDDSLHLSDLQHVIAVSFGLEETAPWKFDDAGERIEADDPLHLHLGVAGDHILHTWGLWEFTVTVVDSWARDDNTPRALCVGGSGSFGGTRFNLNEINAELTGEETIEHVLAGTVPPVSELVERSGLYDFVPLLQALDLRRATYLSEEVRRRLAELPLEDDAAGRDAFWSSTLALASLSGADFAEHVLETIMAALGWIDDDGSRLTAEAAKALCASSLEVLEELGAAGEDVLSPVDRLDLYRELLRYRPHGE